MANKECREDPPLTESERGADERETDQAWIKRIKVLCCALEAAVVLLVVFVVFVVVGVVTSGLVAQTSPVPTAIGFTVLPSENIIEFSPHDPDSYAQYTAVLDEFFRPYQRLRLGGNVINCENFTPNESQVCHFNYLWLDSCNPGNVWGFPNSKPCVLLSYRDDPTYRPVPFVDPQHLPSGIPQELVEYITEKYREDDNTLDKRAWVYCSHALSYHPFQGFMTYNFPNRECEEYVPPLVGVFFDLTKTNELHVECSIWSDKAGGGAVASHSFSIKRIDRNVSL